MCDRLGGSVTGSRPEREMIKVKTASLCDSMGISEQLEGMNDAQKLREVARRFNKLNGPEFRVVAEGCEEMARLAYKYHHTHKP